MRIVAYLNWLYNQAKKGPNKVMHECFTKFYKCLSHSEFMNQCGYLDTINDKLAENEEDRMIYHKYFQLKG